MARGNWSEDYPTAAASSGWQSTRGTRPDWDEEAEPLLGPGGVANPPSPTLPAEGPGAPADPWSDYPPPDSRRLPSAAPIDWSTLDDDRMGTSARTVALADRHDTWRPERRERTRGLPGRPGGLALLRNIGFAVVGAGIVAASGFLWPGWAVTTVFDKPAVEGGMQRVLSTSYGLDVGWVDCPADIAVTADARFTCKALVDGEQVTVPARVTDEDTAAYIVERV